MLLNSGREILIIHKNKTASTNDDAVSAAGKYGEGTLFTADIQTSGRGRKGRGFSSKEGGLYASLLLKPQFSPEKALFITVAAAVAASEAIDKITGKKTEIKWVNDIFLEGKKVCGILTEGAFNPAGDGFLYAVLGFGVNLITPKGDFPPELKDIAGALFKEGDRAKLKEDFLRIFLLRFFEFYENIEKKEFLSLYREKSMLIGKTVTYIKDNREYKAAVSGISDQAELIVERNGKREALLSGEVKIVI